MISVDGSHLLAPVEGVLAEATLRLGDPVCASSNRCVVVLHPRKKLGRSGKASRRLHLDHQVCDPVLRTLLLDELLSARRASETLLVLLLIEEVPAHNLANVLERL